DKPSKTVLNKYKGATKAQCTAIIQMRTGKIGLKDLLNWIGKKESPNCDYDRGRQTVQHTLT
ncbi:hypothetical protein H2199_008834, partial [Coniosporium tulheliwenetii]